MYILAFITISIISFQIAALSEMLYSVRQLLTFFLRLFEFLIFVCILMESHRYSVRPSHLKHLLQCTIEGMFRLVVLAHSLIERLRDF